MFNHNRGRFFKVVQDPAEPKRKVHNFHKTDDLYCLDPQVWQEIGDDMECGAHGFPAAFSDKIRRIDKKYYTYRAHEWKIWNDILMPILYYDRLPPYHYQNLMAGAEAMTIAGQL